MYLVFTVLCVLLEIEKKIHTFASCQPIQILCLGPAEHMGKVEIALVICPHLLFVDTLTQQQLGGGVRTRLRPKYGLIPTLFENIPPGL